MTPIGQLLKFVGSLNPQAMPERLAFYNFLSFAGSDTDHLTPEHINFFFENALDYPHWQQNKNQLGQEVLKILEGAQRNIGLNFDFSKILWPFDSQIVEIQSAKDISEILHNYLTVLCREGEKFRIVADQNKKLIGIVLHESGRVQVHQLDRKMMIDKGALRPIRSQLIINYNENLEITPEQDQVLELAPYTLAQFKLHRNEVHGSAVRGYLFQKCSEFRGGGVSTHLKLFFALKKLEQYFIDRRTDTYYQDLISGLENTLALVNLESSEEHLNHLHRAEMALEQVFPGDKLLSLLVRTLQSELKNKNGTESILSQ